MTSDPSDVMAVIFRLPGNEIPFVRTVQSLNFRVLTLMNNEYFLVDDMSISES